MAINITELLNISTSMNILYAEDDIELRENTSALLSDLFATITQASHGEEAFKLYQDNPGLYDIVITDLNMPHMNGIELIKNIQLINPLQSIIIISAHNETEYFLESIRNNVNGYILKPIDFEQLIDTLYKTAMSVYEHKENFAYKENLKYLVEEKTEELRQSYQQMHTFLTTDKITKLPNATMLYNYLDNIPTDKTMTAMLYNIDDFSFINQTYGFEFADTILEKVGNFLRYNLPENTHLFKYNSDEFVILCDKSALDPSFLATQIQAFFKETPVSELQHEAIYVTLSCGIATSNKASALLPHARTALREAHLRGIPNQYNLYDAQDIVLQKSHDETTWIQRFRIALEEDRVVPYFQPIINNKTELIEKYECLVRIEDEQNVISPAYFLEAARRSGLMSNLTRIMINKSFKIFAGTSLQFSINITNEDLLNDTFINFLVLKQQQYHIEPSRVIFEILEDIILSDLNPIPLKNLNKLKTMGYKLALDDFGNDRSNFSRLETIGVDFIKIDGQFIKEIDKNIRNQNIVETITTLAKKIRVQVIAEFVSTKEEFKIIQQLGIHFSQGYYFDKPGKHLL
ncbi:MAG: EAL domain-containing protein [Sulfurospirillaceae bacterium]|nr:EAL domain-containing protein [Sulfurospirillaceae bacterium]